MQHHKGRRHDNFHAGQNILIRDYTNPNKPSWSSATVKERIGTQSYLCTLSNTKRDIKRHLDQIRVSSNDNSSGDHEKSTNDESNLHEGNLNSPPDDPSAIDGVISTRQLRPRVNGKVIKNIK